MVYTEDLKSLPLKRLWVRIPPRPPFQRKNPNLRPDFCIFGFLPPPNFFFGFGKSPVGQFAAALRQMCGSSVRRITD